MDRQACRAAKEQMIAGMQAGQSWQEAAGQAGVQTSRTAAYRLLQRVRTEGAAALEDQRHGHPTKVREPVRQWLVQFCRAAPEVTGRTVQVALQEQFHLEVSISQVNRLRVALGFSRPMPGAGEKISQMDSLMSRPGRRGLGVCSCSLPPTKQASSRRWSRHSPLASKWLLDSHTPPQPRSASRS